MVRSPTSFRKLKSPRGSCPVIVTMCPFTYGAVFGVSHHVALHVRSTAGPPSASRSRRRRSRTPAVPVWLVTSSTSVIFAM